MSMGPIAIGRPIDQIDDLFDELPVEKKTSE